MFAVPLRTVERLIASLLLAGVRRSWPLLNLVPSSWLRPLLTPTAKRLRRSLERGVLWLSLAAGAAIVLLAALR